MSEPSTRIFAHDGVQRPVYLLHQGTFVRAFSLRNHDFSLLNASSIGEKSGE